MSAWDEARERCAPPRGWAVDCYLGGPDPLPTGTPLDDALGGGLMPGVTVVGGVASAGKSALACHASANVASRGERVLYLTLDDSWGNVVSRCMSAWSVDHAGSWGCGPFSWSALPAMRRQLAPMRSPDPSRDAFELRRRDAALMACAHWDDGPARWLAVVDSMTDVGQIERLLRDLADAGETPALVVVDYVQQYQSGEPELDKGEYGRVSEVSGRLQRLSLWGGFPMLVLSSLRKLSRQDDEPTLDWFRGSGVVGYSAWAACVITKGEREGKGWREAVINVVKNKGGRSGIAVPMQLWGAFSWTRGIE
ncbi:MAG TPA: hypothetical protein IAA15_02555 [Candidatus Olsenella pullicola]|nr:hypothetical protein [Candidatus Olsenella pullicola]